MREMNYERHTDSDLGVIGRDKQCVASITSAIEGNWGQEYIRSPDLNRLWSRSSLREPAEKGNSGGDGKSLHFERSE